MTPKAPESRSRDPEGTRSAILDAAEELFSERGFADASVSAVASRAGVTQSLIHHHFGSKQALWDAVKRRLLAPYLETVARILERSGGGLADLPEAVRVHFELLRESPRLVRIMTWALAEGPEGGPREGAPSAPLLAATIQRLQKKQREGELRDDVDVVAFFNAYLALVEYWFLRRDSLRAGFGDAIPSDDVYLDTIVKLLMDGVSAEGKSR